VGRLLRWPPLRFLLALPSVALLVLVLSSAFLGPADPRLNAATTVTWDVWFCLVFVLIVTTGRGWCLICPFGAVSEAVQRRALWGPGRAVASRRVLPPGLTRYGYLLPIAGLITLTWIEERFAIAEGGAPRLTGYLMVAILVLTLAGFLLLARRGYCRYLCPLSGLIGILGAVAPVAGFRSRDVAACRACTTRECLRSTPSQGGCPWYAWPGAQESNLSCGLCTECYQACPTDQVGLYLTAPLDSVVRPQHRRADVGWGMAALLGLAIQEQVHATARYQAVRQWLADVVPLPEFADIVAFTATIAVVVLVVAGFAWAGVLAARWLRLGAGESEGEGAGEQPRDRRQGSDQGGFVYARSPFRSAFLPMAYACLPLVAADYLAAQLPAFFQRGGGVVPALAHPWRSSGTASAVTSMLSTTSIVTVQVIVVTLGALASLYAGWRLGSAGSAGSAGEARRRRLARLGTGAVVVAITVVLLLLVLAPVLTAHPASAPNTQWLS
jgi:uncharacterized membrane protein YidH (DUF202 family)